MTTKKKPVKLAQVDPAGRIDVALYRVVERLMEQAERDRGLVGMREHLLPIVERAIHYFDLPQCQIPPEVKALVKFAEQNRRRL
jgi:hypothetical protein